jgi:hypothetical protein
MIWFTVNAVLRQRVADLEERLREEREQTKYFRDRYDRLADLTLVRQVNPNAVAPVHNDPPSQGRSLGAQLGKVAALVGNMTGIDRTARPETHGLTIETVER